MSHESKHPLSGKTVLLKVNDDKELVGKEYRIEDWWDRVSGKSWMWAQGNPAAMKYAIRQAFTNPPAPADDEVVYGHVDGYGHLIHESELGEVVR